MKRRKTGTRLKPTNRPKAGAGPKATVVAFDASKEVRAIARERVGTVKPSQTMIPKTARKKPKHKKKVGEEE